MISISCRKGLKPRPGHIFSSTTNVNYQRNCESGAQLPKLLFIGIAVILGICYWSGTSDSIATVRGSEYVYPGYDITPLEPFSIEARVLSRKNYSTGRESDLSTTDFALGWEEMSQPDVLAKIDISQRGRAYYWHTDELPVSRRTIETKSANMHMIAASPQVQRALDSIKQGAMIALKGQLVEIRGDDNWRWRSSLTRNDTGAGACEVVWVESLRLI